MKEGAAPGITFILRPHPPFSLELTAWALRRRASNRIDRWDGRTYCRIFAFGGAAVKVSVFQKGGIERPALNISAAANAEDAHCIKSKASRILEEMFSLRNDYRDFYSLAAKDNRLRPLVERFKGLKPPRFPTIFEALVNAFSCQQVSLDLGIILLNRLSDSFGTGYKEGDTVFHAFPEPGALAGLSPEDFRGLGFSRNKGRAIIELSERVIRGEFEAEALEKMSDADVVQYLSQVRGAGRWSAEYVLLRGLGRINMFPGDDVGAGRNLQDFMGLGERPDYERIKKITSAWRPYSGFVYFHFLLDKLRTKGRLPFN